MGAFDKLNVDAETFQLEIATSYEPAELPVDSSITTVPALDVVPTTGATIYRLAPSADADVVTILLSPVDPNSASALAPAVKLVGPTGTIVETTASAGDALSAVADIRGLTGPFDLYLAGTAGTELATLRIAALEFEDTLALDVPIPAEPNLGDGDFTSVANVTSLGSVWTAVLSATDRPGRSHEHHSHRELRRSSRGRLLPAGWWLVCADRYPGAGSRRDGGHDFAQADRK